MQYIQEDTLKKPKIHVWRERRDQGIVPITMWGHSFIHSPGIGYSLHARRYFRSQGRVNDRQALCSDVGGQVQKE